VTFPIALFLVVLFAAEAGPESRLRFVTTARQKGPVGHRDPIGVISPDGKWLAYSEGRFLRLQRIEGGPVVELEPMSLDVREIAWFPDSLHLAVPERGSAGKPARWYRYDVDSGRRDFFWPGAKDLDQISFSNDGGAVGVRRTPEGYAIVKRDPGGTDREIAHSRERFGYPALAPSGQAACLAVSGEEQHLRLDCAQTSPSMLEEVYGPIAFSPGGDLLYYASPNDRGTLDLWSRRSEDGVRTRLTSFARDSYAPSVDASGRVLFKVQDYRVFLGAAPAAGGPTTALTTFMSETPSWDATGSRIAFTFGNWRRVLDDFHYPDIAQHVGFIGLDRPLPAEAPHGIVSATTSEDQGQSFSPDGKWIAFHSHYGPSDDIWIVPSDLSKPARRLTEGGYETAWPRWSPDGRFILYSTAKGRVAPDRIYVLRMNPETGELSEPEKEIPLGAFQGAATHAEWAPNGKEVYFEAYLGPGRKAIYRVGREGGRPRLIHDFESEERISGIAVSPDARWIAYVAPGPSGYQQVYRVPSSGGTPELITSDPSNKTHPSYSPNGERIAFTVWRYEALFFLLTPSEEREK
jgi:Tol biopolymer transport system component